MSRKKPAGVQATRARQHSSMHVAAQQPAAGRSAGCLHSSACLNRMNSRQKPAAITKTPHCMWLRSSRQEVQRGMRGQPTVRHGSAHKACTALPLRTCTVHAHSRSNIALAHPSNHPSHHETQLAVHARSMRQPPELHSALAHPHPPHHGQRELAEHDLEAEVPHDMEPGADGADLQRADLGGKHLLDGWGGV